MNRNKKKTLDLTQGNVAANLTAFALPLLAASFIQLLYNTVDIFFAGNLIGKDAQAAVGASSLFITCVVGFFTGISVGCSVITAQKTGAREMGEIDRIIHTALGLGLIGGIFLMVLGEGAAPFILRLMKTPPEIYAAGVRYVRIYLLSLLPMCLYNIYAGIIRAFGDSRTPMQMQLIGGFANVIGDYVLIRLLPDGVGAIAFATFFTQTIAATLCLRYMIRGTEFGALVPRRIRLDMDLVKNIIALGVPAGLQNFVITLSNVIVQTKVNRLGVDAIAGYSVYFRVELLNYLPIVAIGSAVMTFCGQNKGAGKTERIHEGIRTALLIGVIYVVAYSCLIFFKGEFAFRLFNPDPGVIAEGMRVIRTTFPFYFLYVFIQVYADAARGCGKSLQPMVIILATICVFRTVCLYLFTMPGVTIERVTATYPAAWLAAAVCLGLYWHRFATR